MPAESLELRTEDGRTAPAEAEITRYGSAARTTKCVGFVLGGVLGGAACIIIPVLHLITTWALPLLGIVLGVRALKRHAFIDRLAGICPGCRESIELHGGPVEDSNHRTCPRCQTRLELVLPA